jgi:hypothetical protein
MAATPASSSGVSRRVGSSPTSPTWLTGPSCESLSGPSLGRNKAVTPGGAKTPGNAPPWLSWQSAGLWFRRVKFESLRGNGSRWIALGMALTPGRVPVRIWNGGSTNEVWRNWQRRCVWCTRLQVRILVPQRAERSRVQIPPGGVAPAGSSVWIEHQLTPGRAGYPGPGANASVAQMARASLS